MTDVGERAAPIVLVATDGFGGRMTEPETGAALAEGVRLALPGAEVYTVPLGQDPVGPDGSETPFEGVSLVVVTSDALTGANAPLDPAVVLARHAEREGVPVTAIVRSSDLEPDALGPDGIRSLVVLQGVGSDADGLPHVDAADVAAATRWAVSSALTGRAGAGRASSSAPGSAPGPARASTLAGLAAPSGAPVTMPAPTAGSAPTASGASPQHAVLAGAAAPDPAALASGPTYRVGLPSAPPYAAGPAAVPAPPARLPVAPTEYIRFWRTPRHRWWKAALLLVSFLAGFFLLAAIFGAIGFGIDLATGTTTFDDLLSGHVRITPTVFLANNLSLAALIPLAMLLQRAFYGQRPRWLSSVDGGIRWRWMAKAAIVILPLWAAYVVIGFVLDPLPVKHVNGSAVFLLVVVLLTTPLQSAGEEYSARGLISRAVASWIPNRIVSFLAGSVAANLLFMLAHGAGDPWLNVFYFLLGMGFSVIVRLTGGLEATILMHSANNVFLLIPVALFGDLGGVFDREAGTGDPSVLIPLATLVVTGVLVVLLARRSGLHRVGPPEATESGREPLADGDTNPHAGSAASGARNESVAR